MEISEFLSQVTCESTRGKRSAYQKGYRHSKKEAITAYGRAWRAKHPTTVWFTRYKSTLSCKYCGERSPICLDFHHREPSKKNSAVANMVRDKKPVSEVQAEIAKCIVVCRNCHAKMHAGTLPDDRKENPHGAL